MGEGWKRVELACQLVSLSASQLDNELGDLTNELEYADLGLAGGPSAVRRVPGPV